MKGSRNRSHPSTTRDAMSGEHIGTAAAALERAARTESPPDASTPTPGIRQRRTAAASGQRLAHRTLEDQLEAVFVVPLLTGVLEPEGPQRRH
jgi:hypothetical protein